MFGSSRRGNPSGQGSSLRLCNQMMDRQTQFYIAKAAKLAHDGNDDSAERARDIAGYGGLNR